jgi:hypothetical protein
LAVNGFLHCQMTAGSRDTNTEKHLMTSTLVHDTAFVSEPPVTQLLNKLPDFYRNQRLIAVFTQPPITAQSNPQSLHNLPSYFFKPHVGLCLPNHLLPSVLKTKTVYAFMTSTLRSMYPLHPIHLHLYIKITSVNSTKSEDMHYVTFSELQLQPSSLIQTFSLALCW